MTKFRPKSISVQKQAFIEAAKPAGADEDESHPEAHVKAVAKPPAKSVRKGQ